MPDPLFDFETDFENRLAALDTQGRACAVHAYTASAFDSIVGTDPDMLNTVADTASFGAASWPPYRLRTFVALEPTAPEENSGRLSATEPPLRVVVKHPGLFSGLDCSNARYGSAASLAPLPRHLLSDAHEPSKPNSRHSARRSSSQGGSTSKRSRTFVTQVFAHAGPHHEGRARPHGKEPARRRPGQARKSSRWPPSCASQMYFDGYPPCSTTR